MTDLGSLGGDRSTASDINDRGQVVGKSTNEQGWQHAFVWQDGVMTALEPMPWGGYGNGINSRGQVVGSFYTDAGEQHAYIWEDGVTTDLGTFGVPDSYGWASDVNNQGQAVGLFPPYGFLWEDGVLLDLETLGGSEAAASAINDRGQVVGNSWTASGEVHAVIWQ